MKKQIIIFSILATFVLTGFVLTNNTQSYKYCIISYRTNTIKIQAGKNKSVRMLDESGKKVVFPAHALEIMDAKGWELVDSNAYYEGMNIFTTKYIMRKKIN